MVTVLLAIAIFGISVFLLSIGLIFSKKARLKKSCGGGLGPTRVDEDGDHVTCGACTCQPAENTQTEREQK
jgi:hypothetical protein